MFRTGFTLIETLIVMAIASLVGVYTIAVNTTSLIRSEVSDERDTFIALIGQQARSAALGNHDGLDQGIFLDNAHRSYVLFAGSIYDPNNNANVTIPYPTRKTTITSSSSLIIFERLSGNVTQGAGVITFDNGEVTQTVDINHTGRINW